jgi:hypothetical protein
LTEWDNSILDADSYMGKAKAEATPKLQAEINKSNSDIMRDMRQGVERWFPGYFQQEVA